MIVALYARVSTAKQAEKDLSIPDQVRQIREWCERQGHSVAVEYIEPGASATNDRRPVFQQMISEACVSPPPFDTVIVHSLSRFFRDSFELAFYERKLMKAGVKLVSITQQTGDDPSGGMLRQMISIFDEYQSKENGKHTLRAMRENARQGFVNGSVPPFGYRKEEVELQGRKGKKKKLAVDPGEAAIVKKVFDIYLNGHNGHALGIYGVADCLNRQGITFRGRPWSKGLVEGVLSNTAYIGEHYFNKKHAKTRKRKPKSEWVLSKVPPILDETIFKRSQRLREARNPDNVPPRVVGNSTLLTGLLKCGCCGAGMTLATGKGGQYRYYKCSTRIRMGNSCGSVNLPTGKLDDLILHSLADKVFTESRVRIMLNELKKRLLNSRDASAGQLKTLTAELEKNQRSLDRLYQAVEEGLLPMDATLTERAHRLQAQRQAILTEIAGIKRQKEMPKQLLSSRHVSAFCQALKGRLLNRSSGFGKRYLRLLVDEIRVMGKEIRIKGSYSALAQAVGQKNLGTPVGVPRFGYAWLPGQDSNLQPSG